MINVVLLSISTHSVDSKSPPDQPIPFHHELAQTPEPPTYIFFYCVKPAETGGETPIIDSTLVYRFANDHHHEFMTKLREHGVRYTRTLPPEDDPLSPIGRSYKNTWQVKSREELDKKLSEMEDVKWDWLDDGCVRFTSQALPGIKYDNHQYTFHNSIIAAFLGWQDCRNDRFKALQFGNGDPMPFDVLESIADFMQKNRILYPWKAGDIMALHNRLVMHSRNPFTGPRRVLASIWGAPLPEVHQVDLPNNVAIGSRPLSFFKTLHPTDPLVFGFWKVPKDICADVCYNAIKAGYRRLDCACDYGNEVEVGNGISKALADGLCKREDLFITSKLWNTFHDPVHVKLGAEKSLEDLNLSYLDEYLIHFPISMEFVPIDKKYPPEWTNLDGNMVLTKNDIRNTWRAMESLVDEGLCRTIGICNFTTTLIRNLLASCRIRPSTLQIELHPFNSQERLVRFAGEAGLHVTAFSIFGATSYVELGGATMEESLLQNDVVKEIAAETSKTTAQVLVRWALQRKTFPLCKTSNQKRLQENRDVFDFFLSGSQMQRLDDLNMNRRYNDPGVFCEAAFGTFCPIYE